MKINKALKTILITDFFVIISGAMFIPISAIFVEDIGGNILDAGVASFVFSFVAGILTILSGNWSDKVKEQEYVMSLGYLITALGFFSYLFVNSVSTLLLVQIVIGTGEAVYNPVRDALYSKHLDKNNEGKEWGIWESMSYFGAAFGALIGGTIAYKFSFDALFVLMGFLSLASAIYTFSLPKKIL